MAAYTTINKPSLHFNTKLYTGNGGTQSITGVGYQPDWVWIKSRSNTYVHALVDSVRGVQKVLQANDSAAEATEAGSLTAFGADGFSLGNWTSTNGSGATFVSWNWKAGGSGSSNSDGSLSATLSTNATAGFSISTFTTPGSGTFTVGHGLGVAPKMVIYRPTGSSSWQVGHDSLGWTYFAGSFNNNAAAASNTAFGNTAPTTSVWTGNTANVGTNSACVAYCFSEIRGYSKFGKYIGNGNVDGTFVYTGFKPAFLIAKRTSSTGSWRMRDNKRFDQANPIDKVLYTNGNTAEVDEDNVDFLSNGFKLRTTGAENNGNGNTMIYMAFAENPIVDSTGKIPATAR
jgi:hypothetical protein